MAKREKVLALAKDLERNFDAPRDRRTLLFRGRKFSPLLFGTDQSFLSKACLAGRLRNFRLLARLWNTRRGQHHVLQLNDAVLDISRLIAIALAGDDELASLIDAAAEFDEKPRANCLGN